MKVDDRLILSPIPIDSLQRIVEVAVTRAVKGMSPDDAQRFISVNDAAALIGCSRVSIYNFIGDGRLKKYKNGSTTRLLRSDVLNLMKECR